MDSIIVNHDLVVLEGVATLTIIKQVSTDIRTNTLLTFETEEHYINILDYWEYGDHAVLDIYNLTDSTINNFILVSISQFILAGVESL